MDLYMNLGERTADDFMASLPAYSQFWGSESVLNVEVKESIKWEMYKQGMLSSIYSDRVRQRMKA